MGNRGDNPWLEFGDSDYFFGVGTLRIDITAQFGRTSCDGSMCLLVEGREYNWDGQVLGMRRAYIRVSALKAAGVPGI